MTLTGERPLNYAILQQRIDLVELLLAHGSSPITRTQSGQVRWREFRCSVDFFINRLARRSRTALQTPRDMAVEVGLEPIVQVTYNEIYFLFAIANAIV